MKTEREYIKGMLEIDGEMCFYKMSVGATDLYKAESGKEYVINPCLGVIDIADLLRFTSYRGD